MRTETARSAHLFLGGVLLLSLLLRLGDLSAPFVYPDDWGHSIFLLFARNYRDYGLFTADTLPYFGLVNGEPTVYSNHPWLLPLALSGWALPFDYSEFSYRSFAILTSVAGTAAIYLMGEELEDKHSGAQAALLFSVAPLSLHTGRTACLELFHITFILWAVLALLKYQRGLWSWKWCALFLVLSQLSDLFGLFLSAGLLLIAAYRFFQKREWKTAVGFALVPIVTQALLILVLLWNSIGQESWERGAGRVGKPWDDWFQLSYWMDTAYKTDWNYGYLMPVLSLVGLALWLKHRKEDRGWNTVLFLLWLVPLLYTLTGSQWLKRHNHLVIFYGPVLAVQTAYLFRREKKRWGYLVLAVHTAVSLWIYGTIFHQRQTYLYPDLRLAQHLRETLRKGDLVVGLPPHLMYYTRYPDVIPWNFYLSQGLKQPSDALDALRPLTEGYKRVLLFPGYLEWPVGFERPDFRPLFPPDSEFRFAGTGESGMLVWEKRE